MDAAPAPRTSLNPTASDWSLLAVLGVLWGGSYVFARIAVEDIGPLTVVAGRVLLATVILTVMVRLRGASFPTSRRSWTPLIVLGVCNAAIPYTLIFWGETRISAGLAAILTAMAPVFTVIAANFLTSDEKVNPLKAAGIGLGLAGVIVIIADGAGDLGGETLGKLAVIGATLLYAFSGVYTRRVSQTSPLVLAWGQDAVAAIVMLPLALIVDRPWATATWHLDAVLSIVALAVFSTVIAYLIFFRLVATIGATNTSLVAFLIPVSSLTLGAAILDEPLVPVQLAGLGLIVAGLAVIDGRLPARFGYRPSPLADRTVG